MKEKKEKREKERKEKQEENRERGGKGEKRERKRGEERTKQKTKKLGIFWPPKNWSSFFAFIFFCFSFLFSFLESMKTYLIKRKDEKLTEKRRGE